MFRNETRSPSPWFWMPMWPGLRIWVPVGVKVFTTVPLSVIVYVPSSNRIS